jgi:hypothetical protein
MYHRPGSMVRARLLTLVSLLALAALTATFVARVDPLRTLLLRIAVPLALALPVCVAALGAGRGLRLSIERALGQRAPDTGLYASAADFTAGLPLFGTLCCLVACVSTASHVLLVPLIACAALGLQQSMRAVLRGMPEPLTLSPSAWIIVASAAAVALTMAQLPPCTRDEVAYHLAVPRAWVLEGRVVELPLNSHSYFPFGVESAALPLLAVAGHDGAIAFHFVMLASLLAGLILLHGFLAQFAAPSGSALALICVASTPALVLTSGTAWIDAPLLALTLGLSHALSQALRAELSTPALARVALFVAAGALTKYTWAVVLMVGFGAALVACGARREPLLRLTACAVAGLTLGSVFFVRNLLWTGNPVAPFLDPSTPHVAAFNQGQSLADVLLNYVFDPLMVDESLGALLLAFALVFVAVQRELIDAPFARALGALSLLALCMLVALGAAGRLLVPFAVLPAGLALTGLARLCSSSAPRLGRAVAAACIAIALGQLAFLVTAVAQYEPLAVLREDEANVLARLRPLYPAIRFLDDHLPDRSRTLVLGIQESYWFRHNVRSGGNFDGPRVTAFLSANSPSELAARWRRAGFTHVAYYRKNLIVGASPLAGRRAESKTTLDPATAALLRDTMNQHTTTLAEAEGVVLLAVRP